LTESPSIQGREPAGPDARRIALNALMDVAASGAYSTLALDITSGRAASTRRQAPGHHIFYTALEKPAEAGPTR
jgi:hypothetical protein